MVHFCEDGIKLKIPSEIIPHLLQTKLLTLPFFQIEKGIKKFITKYVTKNICLSELCTFLKQKGKQKKTKYATKIFFVAVYCVHFKL